MTATAGSRAETVSARVRRIELAETRMPRPRSSPWMRTQPQRRFSWAIRTMSSTSSSLMGGRPGPRVDRRRRHLRLESSRCQRSRFWCPTGTFLTRISKFRADGRVLPQYIWVRQASGTMQEAVRLGAKSFPVPRSSRLLHFASDHARPGEVDRGFKPSPHFGGDVEAVF